MLYNLNVDERLKNLDNSNISESNKILIKRFTDECFTMGLGDHRVLKYISTMKLITEKMNIDLETTTIEDIKKYVAWLERSDKAAWTKHDYKVTIKKFFRWLNGKEDDPEITRWIKTSIKKNNKRLPEDMLKEEDVIKLVDAAVNTRDKALIAMLWDLGARIGEIGDLQIKHINFDEYGAKVTLNGKTGARVVRAVWCIPYLMGWIEQHPDKKNPESRLWAVFDDKRRANSTSTLMHGAIRMQLKRIVKRAGIKKKITPHIFRHSRATYMANHLTEAQMNAYFGWVQGSGMPSIYVHLSGKDVDKSVLRANGIEIEDDTKQAATKPIQCPRCAKINTANATFCFNCGAALTLKTAMDMDENKGEFTVEMMQAALSDPAIQKMLIEKMAFIKK